MSSVRKRLLNTKVKEKEADKYSGETIYVDKASILFFSVYQVYLQSKKTIRGKCCFKRTAIQEGVNFQQYGDNTGIFKSETYQKELKQLKQSLLFSGVGDHH